MATTLLSLHSWTTTTVHVHSLPLRNSFYTASFECRQVRAAAIHSYIFCSIEKQDICFIVVWFSLIKQPSSDVKFVF